ncbi:hypothetical protein [uncultured Luteimonas sp.]|uniref:hypothetical protein n=1 Tax=uncultured Luteimonas sp. TaxID=453144 RepID=UPI002631C2D3|nr:hypothetical protein [uncultured Luteimonas sp.]
MNRKLRNTILAFSVTGTVLALGLIAARPVTPDALQPPAVAASAGPSGEAMEAGERPQAQDSAAPAAEYGVNDDVQARSLARSRQFEDEITRTASLDTALALTAGFVATTTAEAVVSGILSTDAPAAAAATAAATGDAEAAPRRRRGSVRRAVAVPYFSFSRATGRGVRS